jgi:cytochrome c2
MLRTASSGQLTVRPAKQARPGRLRMRRYATRAGLLLIKFVITSSTALAAGDPAAGDKVFASHCAACHATTPGENKIGPSLAGIVGSSAA